MSGETKNRAIGWLVFGTILALLAASTSLAMIAARMGDIAASLEQIHQIMRTTSQ